MKYIRLGGFGPFCRVFGGHWNFMIWNEKMMIRDTSILPGDVGLLYVMLGYQDLALCGRVPLSPLRNPRVIRSSP